MSRAECHIPHKAFLTAEVFYAIFHFVRCSLPMKRSVDPFDCRYFLEGSVKAHSLVYSEKTITQVQTTMLAHQLAHPQYWVRSAWEKSQSSLHTNCDQYVCVCVLCGNNAVAVWDKKCELSVGDPCVFTMWLLLEDNIQLTFCHSHSPTLAVKKWNQRFGWWSDFWVEGWWLEGWSIS